jgi:hypothetical protein
MVESRVQSREEKEQTRTFVHLSFSLPPQFVVGYQLSPINPRKTITPLPSIMSATTTKPTIRRVTSSVSIASTDEEWKRLDHELVIASGIDNAKGSRMETLATILRKDYQVVDVNLVRALVALGEATSHIAVHLTNYVDHTYAGSQNQSGDDQLYVFSF